MNEILVAMFGIAVGTWYAETIRDHIPALDPKPSEPSEVAAK